MKSKLSLLCVCIIFCSSIANSQKLRLQAGINLSNVTVSEDGRIDDANSLILPHAGLIADLPFAGIFSIQTGLLYTGKGTQSTLGDNSNPQGTFSEATSKAYYVELPLNFIFKTPQLKRNGSGSRLFVGAGPYVAAGITGKLKNSGRLASVRYNNERNIEFSNDDPSTLDYEEGSGFGILKRFDYGLNALAGVEGKSLVLTLNYGYGLAKLQSGTTSSTDDNNKYRVLGLSVGFKL